MITLFPKPRRFAIGDVHGCLDELQILLTKINFRPNYDFLMFVGDLVDRGPDSNGVVTYIRDLKTRFSKIGVVRGNHDDRYARYFSHELKHRANPHHKNNMFLNEEKRAVYNSLSEENLFFLMKLPNYLSFEHSNWVAVHAGFEPGIDLERQDPDQMKHLRYLEIGTNRPKGLTKEYKQPPNTQHWTKVYDLPYNVVCGHHVHSFEKPVCIERPNGTKIVCVDTGCAYGGFLTAYNIDTGEYEQVKPAKQYSEAYE